MASDDPSERLRLFRESVGLTQGQLAKKIGRSQAFIAKIERGQGAPSSDLQSKLFKEFSLNPTWLIHGRGEMYLSDRDELELRKVETPGPDFQETMAMIDGLPKAYSDGFVPVPFYGHTGNALNFAPFALSRAWLKSQELPETDLFAVRLIERNPQLGLLDGDLALVDSRKPVRATGDPMAFSQSAPKIVRVAMLIEIPGQGYVIQDPETGKLSRLEDWESVSLIGRLVAHWRMHSGHWPPSNHQLLHALDEGN